MREETFGFKLFNSCTVRGSVQVNRSTARQAAALLLFSNRASAVRLRVLDPDSHVAALLPSSI